MKTLAERFGFAPTRFLPNGCGTGGWLGKLVPDEISGVDFDTCCDLHDLAYHVGRGGWHGLFWAKPAVDWDLSQCMERRFIERSVDLNLEGRLWKSRGVFVLAVAVPVIYLIGLTLLGWTPLTWPWKQRPMPSHEDLERLLAHNRND